MAFVPWRDWDLLTGDNQEITTLYDGEVFIVFVDVFRRYSINVAFPKGHLAPIRSIKDISLYPGAELRFCTDEVRRVLHEIWEFIHNAHHN